MAARQRPGHYAPLPVRFFRDPKTRRARASDERAGEGFLVLVADEAERSRAGGEPGVCKMGWDDYCAQLGIPEDAERVERMFAAFQNLGWVDVQESDEYGFKVFLPNAAEWSGGVEAADRQASSRDRKETEIRALREDPARVPAPDDRYTHEQVRLCDLLAGLILRRDPKAAVAPESVPWMDACRLLIDRDGRSVAEVEHVIHWCQHDEFWRTNILSMPTLRRQFTKLAARAPKVKDRAAWEKAMGMT